MYGTWCQRNREKPYIIVNPRDLSFEHKEYKYNRFITSIETSEKSTTTRYIVHNTFKLKIPRRLATSLLHSYWSATRDRYAREKRGERDYDLREPRWKMSKPLRNVRNLEIILTDIIRSLHYVPCQWCNQSFRRLTWLKEINKGSGRRNGSKVRNSRKMRIFHSKGSITPPYGVSISEKNPEWKPHRHCRRHMKILTMSEITIISFEGRNS